MKLLGLEIDDQLSFNGHDISVMFWSSNATEHFRAWQINAYILVDVLPYTSKNLGIGMCTDTLFLNGFYMYIFLWRLCPLHFASLFCMSKGEHLWNKEKCFLFHFESSFRSWDNQILNFQIFKYHDVIKYLSMKHEIHFVQ